MTGTNSNIEQKLFKYSDKLSEIEGKVDMLIKQLNKINEQLDAMEWDVIETREKLGS